MKLNERILKSLSFRQKLFHPIERKLLKRYKGDEIEIPPVFIIGPPRAGSTILYQYMTNYLDVSYINNFMNYFVEVLFTSSITSKKMLGNKPHNSFRSNRGNTEGLISPNEGGNFWYRWVGRETHFVDFNEVSQRDMEEIRTTITAITNRHHRPVVFKNMNAGLRLRLIKQIFPGSVIIIAKRDPIMTAQSIIFSREKGGGNRNTWWSIKPKEYPEIKDLPYEEQVVKQIYYIQKQIDEDIKLFGSGQHIEIHYRDFCDNPKDVLDQIVDMMRSNGISINYKDRNIQDRIEFSNTIKLEKETLEKVKHHLRSCGLL